MSWEDAMAQWAMKTQTGIRVLSIDGGGTRGIFPARYLARIEDHLGQPVHKYFDMIVGTSTGGIIALALASGVPAETICDLYVRQSKVIFRRRKPWQGKAAIVFGSIYSNEGLEEELKRVLGESRIRDARTMLCVPALEHHKAAPKVYKTPHDERYHADADLPMWKVGLATSAAPIYFPPVCVSGQDCKIDGGLWANNPILVGIAEAVGHGIPIGGIRVLSLGTGLDVYRAENNVAHRNSLPSWGVNLLHLTMNAQSEGHLNTAKYLIGENLTRVNFVSTTRMDLDTVRDEDFAALLHEADTAFEKTFKNGDDVHSKFFRQEIGRA